MDGRELLMVQQDPAWGPARMVAVFQDAVSRGDIETATKSAIWLSVHAGWDQPTVLRRLVSLSMKELGKAAVAVPAPVGVPAGGALSSREKQVLVRIGRGMTNQQVAEDLSLKISTIKTVLFRLPEKMSAYSNTRMSGDRAVLVAMAIHLGWLTTKEIFP